MVVSGRLVARVVVALLVAVCGVAPVRVAAVAARTPTVVAAEEAASAVAVAAPVAVVPGQAVRMRRQFQ